MSEAPSGPITADQHPRHRRIPAGDPPDRRPRRNLRNDPALPGACSAPLERLALILIVAVNLATAWLVFLVAERLDRFLGATGRIVLTRLLGLFLAALAVQFVADGVTALVRANG